MWSWLASFLGGPVISGLISAYKAKLDAQTKGDAQAVELASAEILGEVSLRQAEASIIRQEQGWWVTAMIRPLMALPFIIFTWKVVIYDKALGWGSTDALDPNMWSVFMIVVGSYFGGRSLEKVARIFARRK